MYRFPPWLPDLDGLNPEAAMQALGVIPTAGGYRPFPNLAFFATALTARAQGAISVRDTSGNVFNFYGDATKLYKKDASGTGVSDVSRAVGGAYAVPADGWWYFWQYGNLVFAANGADALQSFNLASSTNFAAAAGSPPVSTFGMTVREFSVLLRSAGAFTTVSWSGLGDATTYVPSATTLSDSQILADGGTIMGGIGGEYGLIFQERGIQRMAFEGPPTAFRFDKITVQLGVRAEGSIAGYQDLAFFLADNGLKMIRGGVEIIEIGDEKWDRFLETDIDSSYLYRVSSAIDPINKLYVMGYASTSGGGSPDTLFKYHWPTGKASLTRINHEIIFTAATQSGVTLDGLDALYASIDVVPFSLDSRIWTGSGRLLLGGFDTSHRPSLFSGGNVAATIETGDAQLTPGYMSMVCALRPVIQGANVTPAVSVGRRNHLHQSVTYGPTVTINSNGICRVRSKGRYHRAKVIIPAASDWQHAVGVDDIDAKRMGKR